MFWILSNTIFKGFPRIENTEFRSEVPPKKEIDSNRWASNISILFLNGKNLIVDFSYQGD